MELFRLSRLFMGLLMSQIGYIECQDMMVDGPFGEMPNPLLMAANPQNGAIGQNAGGTAGGMAVGSGRGLAVGNAGGAASGGFDYNLYDLFMGPDPSSQSYQPPVHDHHSSNGMGSDLLAHAHPLITTSSSSTKATATPSSPNTANRAIAMGDPSDISYEMQNEAFTQLGHVGHLVKVQSKTAASKMAGEHSSNRETVNGSSLAVSSGIGNVSSLSGSDKSTLATDASKATFNPGTGMDLEMAALQSALLGTAVDMTGMIPPPFELPSTHSTGSSVKNEEVNASQANAGVDSISKPSSRFSSYPRPNTGFQIPNVVGGSVYVSSPETTNTSGRNSTSGSTVIGSVVHLPSFKNSSFTDTDSTLVEIAALQSAILGTEVTGMEPEPFLQPDGSSVSHLSKNAFNKTDVIESMYVPSSSNVHGTPVGLQNRRSLNLPSSIGLLSITNNVDENKPNIKERTSVANIQSGYEKNEGLKIPSSAFDVSSEYPFGMPESVSKDIRKANFDHGIDILAENAYTGSNNSPFFKSKDTVNNIVVGTLSIQPADADALSSSITPDRFGSQRYMGVSTTAGTVEPIVNVAVPEMPHVQDLSSDGIYPFEGSFIAREATINQGAALISDMNKAIETSVHGETLHIEPISNELTIDSIPKIIVANKSNVENTQETRNMSDFHETPRNVNVVSSKPIKNIDFGSSTLGAENEVTAIRNLSSTETSKSSGHIDLKEDSAVRRGSFVIETGFPAGAGDQSLLTVGNNPTEFLGNDIQVSGLVIGPSNHYNSLGIAELSLATTAILDKTSENESKGKHMNSVSTSGFVNNNKDNTQIAGNMSESHESLGNVNGVLHKPSGSGEKINQSMQTSSDKPTSIGGEIFSGGVNSFHEFNITQPVVSGGSEFASALDNMSNTMTSQTGSVEVSLSSYSDADRSITHNALTGLTNIDNVKEGQRSDLSLKENTSSKGMVDAGLGASSGIRSVIGLGEQLNNPIHINNSAGSSNTNQLTITDNSVTSSANLNELTGAEPNINTHVVFDANTGSYMDSTNVDVFENKHNNLISDTATIRLTGSNGARITNMDGVRLTDAFGGVTIGKQDAPMAANRITDKQNLITTETSKLNGQIDSKRVSAFPRGSFVIGAGLPNSKVIHFGGTDQSLVKGGNYPTEFLAGALQHGGIAIGSGYQGNSLSNAGLSLSKMSVSENVDTGTIAANTKPVAVDMSGFVPRTLETSVSIPTTQSRGAGDGIAPSHNKVNTIKKETHIIPVLSTLTDQTLKTNIANETRPGLRDINLSSSATSTFDKPTSSSTGISSSAPSKIDPPNPNILVDKTSVSRFGIQSPFFGNSGTVGFVVVPNTGSPGLPSTVTDLSKVVDLARRAGGKTVNPNTNLFNSNMTESTYSLSSSSQAARNSQHMSVVADTPSSFSLWGHYLNPQMTLSTGVSSSSSQTEAVSPRKDTLSTSSSSSSVAIGNVQRQQPIVGQLFGDASDAGTVPTVDGKYFQHSSIMRTPTVDFMTTFFNNAAQPSKTTQSGQPVVQFMPLEKTVDLNAGQTGTPAVDPTSSADTFGVADIYTRQQQLNPTQWRQFMSSVSHDIQPSKDVVGYQTENVVGTGETRPLNTNEVGNTNLVSDTSRINALDAQLDKLRLVQIAKQALINKQPKTGAQNKVNSITSFKAPGMTGHKSVPVNSGGANNDPIVNQGSQAGSKQPMMFSGRQVLASQTTNFQKALQQQLKRIGVPVFGGQAGTSSASSAETSNTQSIQSKLQAGTASNQRSFPDQASKGMFVLDRSINLADVIPQSGFTWGALRDSKIARDASQLPGLTSKGFRLGQAIVLEKVGGLGTMLPSQAMTERVVLPSTAEAPQFTSGGRVALFGGTTSGIGRPLRSSSTINDGSVAVSPETCRHHKDPTSDNYFIMVLGSQRHRFRCALGTAFDPVTCECSTRVADSGDCLEVHMDFNNGIVEDSSFNKLPIGNENVEVTNKSTPLTGIALFGGDSKLTIWRYQNYDFRDHIMLKLQFRPGPGGDRFQPLLTNCDAGGDGPSVGIVYDSTLKEVDLLLNTDNDTNKQLKFSINPDEWNDVTYIYDGQEFIGIVNGVRRYISRHDPHLLGIIGGEIKSLPTQGLIEIRDAAIVLGHCPRYGYFRGAMVDIQIYTCIPKDFRLE